MGGTPGNWQRGRSRTLQRQALEAFMFEAGSQCPGARGVQLGWEQPLCVSACPHPSLPRTPSLLGSGWSFR